MSLGELFVLRDRGLKRTDCQIEPLLAGVDAAEFIMRVRVASASQRNGRAEFFCSFRHAAKAV